MMSGRYKIEWNRGMHTSGGIVGSNEGLMERHDLVLKTLKYSPFICRYEDLVRNPDSIQDQLEERFGFHYKDRFRNFHSYCIPDKLRTRLNGVRPVTINRIESWKEHPARIFDQFTQCKELFNLVKYWGYEENDDWFDEVIKRKEMVCSQ